jgi:serine/threonine-protein kinase
MSENTDPVPPEPIEAPPTRLPSTEIGIPPPPRDPVAEDLPPMPRRYVLGDEIARGGMGAVIRGRDELLGRDVAVKVLHERLREHNDVRSRFHDEARIGGQLQHPGVVPVYDLGHLADGRPFFAMKLVKGRTLAELLHERADPGADLGRFLQIFHQVCQTMAYAHSRHVIHRDLKPANIMVGPFGEVLVMDWGLGKVIGSAQVRDAEAPAGPLPSTIATARAGSPDQQTHAGAVLGTFPYMAPEQAAGQIERLDERCDVFSLGAILCEILIGRPPYEAPDTDSLRIKALTADQAEALALLGEPQIDGDLASLARSCLERNPDRRPADAAAVAEAMERYLGGVQERLRQAELARAEAQVKAQEERKRRRITAYLAAAILATFGVGVAAYYGVSQQQQARRQQTALVINQALSEARALQEQARRLREQPARAVPLWQTALARAEQAERARENGPADDELIAEVASLRAELQGEAEEAEKDRVMLERLDRARDLEHELQEDDFIRIKNPRYFVFGQAAIPAYASAFREYGIDVPALTTEEAAARIRRRPIHFRLAVGLDDWYFLDPKAAGGRLLEVSRAADPDDLRNRVRAGIAAGDFAGLEKLAADPEAAKLPPPTLILLASVLHQHDRRLAALELLRRGQQRYRNDFWINDVLGLHTSRNDPPNYQEAVGCFTAAVALRPDSPVGWNNLGQMLEAQGFADAAVRALREGIAAHPEFSYSWRELSAALLLNHQPDEALAEVEKALKTWPKSPILLTQLAEVLYAQEKRADAEAILKQVLAERPEYFRARTVLADLLCTTNRIDEAERVLDEDRSPEYDLIPGVHATHCAIFHWQGKFQEAVQECEKALQLSGGDVGLAVQMGIMLGETNQAERGLDYLRRAVNQAPALSSARVALAAALRLKGRGEDAAAQAGEAVRLDPKNPFGHNEMGMFLLQQGKFPAAAEEFRASIRLAPHVAFSYASLADALAGQNDFDDAMAAHRKAIALQATPRMKSNFNARAGDTLYFRGRYTEAIPYYREAIRLQQGAPVPLVSYRLGFAQVSTGQIAAGVEALKTAARLEPKNAYYHADLAIALSRAQKPSDALAEALLAIRLDRRIARAHTSLGIILENQNKPEQALQAYREAARLAPAHADTLAYLGMALLRREKFDEAVVYLQEVARLQEKNPVAHLRLAQALRGQRRYREALEALHKAIPLQPMNPALRDELINVLWDSGQTAAAEVEARKLIKEAPNRFEGYHLVGQIHLARHELAPAAGAFTQAILCGILRPGGYVNLGLVYQRGGKFLQAELLFRLALLLDSRSGDAHLALGRLYLDLRRPTWAEAEFRTLQKIFPRSGMALSGLSQALAAQHKVQEAFEAAHQATLIEPLAAEHPVRLGEALLLRGSFIEALNAFREAKRLFRATQNAVHPLPIDERIREAARCLELDGVLTAVQSKRARLTDAKLLAELARFCAERKDQPAAAVRFFTEVFAAVPSLADDLDAGHRFHAACAAIQAAAGQGDAAKASDEERTRLRRQALDWLRADVTAWRTRLEKSSPQERTAVLLRLRDIKDDFTLSSALSEAALLKLPSKERAAWQALATDLDALIAAGRR